MLRVRSFTQDGAHLFVRFNQIESEIEKIHVLIEEFYSYFGFDYKIELSTRPEEHMGSEEIWDKTELALESVLKDKGINYQLIQGTVLFMVKRSTFIYWIHTEEAGNAALFN
ncbi:hypothetical protein PZE06_19630 [Robertmurraya sp. DFI.2.37]|nr:hypothetical protein [Robertmurraya sp. DFI.2.37]